jgi:hypothetical protein
MLLFRVRNPERPFRSTKSLRNEGSLEKVPAVMIHQRAQRVLLLGAILLGAGCGGGEKPPETSSSSPSSSSTPGTKKPAASGDAGGGGAASSGPNTAAIEKLSAEEAKSGNCDADTKAAFDKLVDDVETSVRAKKDESGSALKIESFTKRVLALSEAAKGIELTLSGKGTQVHVLAFSTKEVSMDVLAGKEAATTMRSPYQREVVGNPAKINVAKLGGAIPLESDSRQIEMKVGTPLQVKMRGQGCAGVVVFSKS